MKDIKLRIHLLRHRLADRAPALQKAEEDLRELRPKLHTLAPRLRGLQARIALRGEE